MALAVTESKKARRGDGSAGPANGAVARSAPAIAKARRGDGGRGVTGGGGELDGGGDRKRKGGGALDGHSNSAGDRSANDAVARSAPAIALLLRRVVPLPPPDQDDPWDTGGSSHDIVMGPAGAARNIAGGTAGASRDTGGGTGGLDTVGSIGCLDTGGDLSGRALRVLLDGWGGAQWCAMLEKRTAGAGEAERRALQGRLEAVMGRGGDTGGEGGDAGGGGGRKGRNTGAGGSGSALVSRPPAAPLAPTPLTTKLDLAALFGLAGGDARPPPRYRLELGCGLGEWLAAQAAAAPGVQWVGVELMARRAYATAARVALAGR
jgi:hypothetical protein